MDHKLLILVGLVVVSGQDTIRITTTDTWSFSVTGMAGIYYEPNSSSGRGNDNYYV